MHGTLAPPRRRLALPSRLPLVLRLAPARAARRLAAASASSSPASRSASPPSPASPRSRARSPKGSPAKAARSSAATWRSRSSTAKRTRRSGPSSARGAGLVHRHHAGHGGRGREGSALVEVKAVDAAYPAVGALVTEPAAPSTDCWRRGDGASARSSTRRCSPGSTSRSATASPSASDDRAARGPGVRTRQDRQRHRLRAAPPGLAGGLAGTGPRPAGQPGALDLPAEPAGGRASDADLERVAGGGRRRCRRPVGESARASTPIRASPATSSASPSS